MWSNIFYLAFLFVGIFRTECINKYCSSNVCNNTKQHTLCKFQSTDPARHCVDYERTIRSDRDKILLLDKINARRNKVASGEIRSLPSAEDMLIMEWNEELAESAQRWADQCVTHRHSVGDVLDACRDLVDMEVGQNIATVYGEAPGLTPMSLVDVWYMELLNMKPGVISQYTTSIPREETCTQLRSNSTMCVKQNHSRPSGEPWLVSSRYNATGTSPYKYFTQLVWADSYQVGCGGVKFKERLDDSDYKKNRTVYRLVCNFAPRGNQVGKAVYTAGPTGSKCIYGTNKNHTSLCDTKPAVDDDIDELVDEPKNLNFTGDISDTDTTVEHNSTLNTEALAITDLNEDDNTTFDYFSHLYQLTKDYLTSTTTTKAMCNKELAVDEIVEFLKKKLSSDPTLQQLFTTTLPISTGSVFRDASVVAFLDKIYSKAVLTTTTETPNADFVNSTLLVNLVEAVIFRNTDSFQAPSEVTQEIQIRPYNFVHPVPVQAEMVPVKQNYDVTGHYFFPEDDIEEAAKETTEPDYDMSYAPSMQDVVHEIEELRKNKPTRDFLYDILETESAVESTTKFKLLSPDDMNLHTSGYSNMKIFLKEIADKSENHNAEHLISA
ncbi:uncharacterized protein isoform X2 [Choristoneura fumiferana]|uniref:uncharacterized protein isoform X2 n=1 Tax=Choristoneura fumiferana TaxID=7141 RepID=UPI003D154199